MAHRARHIVLLGDSIFDNAAYVSGAPDVVAHLRAMIPATWRASLLARDGATIADLGRQLRAIPADASHVVISVGGNDMLRHIDLLSLTVSSCAEALEAFASRVGAFEEAYRDAVAGAATPSRQAVLCTIYNGALNQDLARIARIGVAIFNDVILRTAIDLRIEALELRSVCNEPADYANPIEPSAQGGAKIARGIAALAGAVPSVLAPARIWGSPLAFEAKASPVTPRS
jgi:lysophospholipase L1-like esterase